MTEAVEESEKELKSELEKIVQSFQQTQLTNIGNSNFKISFKRNVQEYVPHITVLNLDMAAVKNPKNDSLPACDEECRKKLIQYLNEFNELKIKIPLKLMKIDTAVKETKGK